MTYKRAFRTLPALRSDSRNDALQRCQGVLPGTIGRG